MAEDYARELMKRSVARSCVALGIKTAQSEVIDVMADVVKHYIESIGHSTIEHAESTGRVNPGIQDLLNVILNIVRFPFNLIIS